MDIKKILLILVISFFPLMIYADGPIDCCQLRQVIEFDKLIYPANSWVGESSCGDGTIIDGCTLDTTTGNPAGNCETSKWGVLCTLNAVYTVIDWIFFGLIAMVSLFTILGAFDILTAAGDPEKIKKGRERIMYAMIGLAVALLSRAIPGVVEALIG